MNERERLLAVLAGNTPDKTPWYADLSYLYTSMQIRGVLDEKYYGDEGYLQFHKDLGAGICFYAPFPWKTEYNGGVQYSQAEEGGIRTCSYVTPVGSLTSVYKYLPTTYTWAMNEHFVNSIEDLRTMLYIFEHTRYFKNYDEFKGTDALWAESGIAVAFPPVSASTVQKLFARWAGVENTVRIYADDMEEFDEIVERIQASEDEAFNILADSPAPVIEFAENLSSEITGKYFFEKYHQDYYQKRIKQLHAAGKYASIHIDGTLKGCLPLLEHAGFDAAEAVTPAPIGDIEIEDLRKWSGDRIVIWGGLPGALFSPLYSEEEFENHLERVFRTFPVGSRFVLGVADQVPPDGLISRVKRVREFIGD